MKYLIGVLLIFLLTGCYEAVRVKAPHMESMLKLCTEYGGVNFVELRQMEPTTPPYVVAYCHNGFIVSMPNRSN